MVVQFLPLPLLTDSATGDTCTIGVEPNPADPIYAYWTLRLVR